LSALGLGFSLGSRAGGDFGSPNLANSRLSGPINAFFAKDITKAGGIACVPKVANCGTVTTELGAWLLLMLESPLAS
jgi:hypothetical protein